MAIRRKRREIRIDLLGKAPEWSPPRDSEEIDIVQKYIDREHIEGRMPWTDLDFADPLYIEGILEGFEYSIPYTEHEFSKDYLFLDLPGGLGIDGVSYIIYLNAITGNVYSEETPSDITNHPNSWKLGEVTIPKRERYEWEDTGFGVIRSGHFIQPVYPSYSSVGVASQPYILAPAPFAYMDEIPTGISSPSSPIQEGEETGIISGLNIDVPRGDDGQILPVSGYSLRIDIYDGVYKRNAKSVSFKSGKFRKWTVPEEQGWDGLEEDVIKTATVRPVSESGANVYLYFDKESDNLVVGETLPNESKYYKLVSVDIPNGALMLKEEWLREERGRIRPILKYEYIKELHYAINYKRIQILELEGLAINFEDSRPSKEIDGPVGPQEVIGYTSFGFGKPILGPIPEPEKIYEGGSTAIFEFWDRPRRTVLKLLALYHKLSGLTQARDHLKDWEGNPRGFYPTIRSLQGGGGSWDYHLINDFRFLIDTCNKIYEDAREEKVTGQLEVGTGSTRLIHRESNELLYATSGFSAHVAGARMPHYDSPEAFSSIETTTDKQIIFRLQNSRGHIGPMRTWPEVYQGSLKVSEFPWVLDYKGYVPPTYPHPDTVFMAFNSGSDFYLTQNSILNLQMTLDNYSSSATQHAFRALRVNRLGSPARTIYSRAFIEVPIYWKANPEQVRGLVFHFSDGPVDEPLFKMGFDASGHPGGVYPDPGFDAYALAVRPFADDNYALFSHGSYRWIRYMRWHDYGGIVPSRNDIYRTYSFDAPVYGIGHIFKGGIKNMEDFQINLWDAIAEAFGIEPSEDIQLGRREHSSFFYSVQFFLVGDVRTGIIGHRGSPAAFEGTIRTFQVEEVSPINVLDVEEL